MEIIDNAMTTTYQSSNSFNIDVTAPVVTLIGSGSEDVFSGATYVDAGATWDDGANGSGTIVAYNSGTLNTSQT